MWVQEKFLVNKKFKRIGKLATLTLPKDVKFKENLYKLNIKAKSLDFVKGNHMFIISDEIGISDKAEFELFFMEDCMCFRLIKGLLYVRDSEGKVFSINTKHKIVEYCQSLDKIIWKNMSNLKTFVEYVLESKYHLSSFGDKKQYMHNLLFTVVSEYNPYDCKLFTIRFTNLSEEIGGSFNFEIKEKKETVFVGAPVGSEDKENDLYSQEQVITKSKKNIRYDEDEDLDDDMDGLPDSMHEISIFNYYTSIDDTY